MQVTRKDVDALNAVITIAIDQADLGPKVDSVLTSYKKRANIPGFRKGNVPMGLIRKQYGQAVKADEVNKMLQESLSNYISKEQLALLGNPLPVEKTDFDWEAETLAFDFELGLSPEFDLKLKGRKAIIHYQVEADKKMIDNQIERMRSQYGSLHPLETVEAGAELTATFTGEDIEKKSTFSLDDVKSAAQKKKLIGAKVGDAISLKTKGLFKDDHKLMHVLGVDHDRAHGLNVEVTCTIEEINKRELADLDQDFFDKVMGKDVVKNATELKDKLKADAEKQFVTQADQKMLNDVTEYLIDNTKFSLPDTFLKKWIQQSGEQVLSEEEAASEYEKSERGIRYQLIESKLVSQYDLKIDMDQIKDFAKDMIKTQMLQFGRADVADQELEDIAGRILGNQDEVKRISDQLMSRKMIDLFKAEANLKLKKVKYDDFVKEAYKA
jgi:trigger factor